MNAMPFWHIFCVIHSDDSFYYSDYLYSFYSGIIFTFNDFIYRESINTSINFNYFIMNYDNICACVILQFIYFMCTYYLPKLLKVSFIYYFNNLSIKIMQHFYNKRLKLEW